MNWERVRLGEVLEYEQPTNYIVSSEDYDDSFETPVLTAGKSFILGYTNEKENIYTNVPVIIFDDFTTAAKYVDFPFKVKSSAMKILKALENKADIKYLYYKMQTINFNATEHKRYWISKYSQIEIPLPPMSVQKEIVEKLDKAAAIREKSKALLAYYDALAESLFIELFGDPISNEKGWEKKKLGEVCEMKSGGTPSRKNPSFFEGTIKWCKISDIENAIVGVIYDTEEKITVEGLDDINGRIFPKGTLLLAMYGASIGKLAFINEQMSVNQALLGINIKNVNLIDSKYLYYWFTRNKKILLNKSIGVAQKNISKEIVENIEISLPPLSLQVKFAEMVENIEKQKARAKAEIEQGEAVFQALLQESFG